jgi:hypothetical protein
VRAGPFMARPTTVMVEGMHLYQGNILGLKVIILRIENSKVLIVEPRVWSNLLGLIFCVRDQFFMRLFNILSFKGACYHVISM